MYIYGVKHIKRFHQINEFFKVKNISIDDVIKCIERRGKIYATIIKNFPDNDPLNPITPLSIDDSGLITTDINGKEYEIDLKNVDKIEY